MKIFIVTERRADFSRFRPILKLIKKENKINYQLVVTGLHLVKKYGYTINEIKKDKIKIHNKFVMFNKKYFHHNDGAAMSDAMGIAFRNLSKILKKSKPDLILSGFDIAANFALTVCGAHMNIPVAHIQGGEVSGTIDESIRHGMSKFSNIHFTANKETENRLIKMGEIKKNIFVVGCPSIDALKSEKQITQKKIFAKFKLDLTKPYSIVIQHSVTSEIYSAQKQMKQTILALKKFDMQHLIIFPNNDAGSDKIIKMIKKSNLNCVPSLNLTEYKTLLANCEILIGNSSSGVHEAATFKIPVVNIGTRQNGRTKPKNVLNVDHNPVEIIKAIKLGLSNRFKKKIKNIKNPYGDGNSATKIVKIIKSLNLKKFNTQKKITY
jgi:GDP/UDP-N,N'-diacetylbacillosamine 2-epimerase (hydrolysing)